jgi:hypothetical protein
MNGFQKENIEDVYPMSDIQKGMVYHALKNPEIAVYHNQIFNVYPMADFKPAIFRNAIELMVKKHSILRTLFNLTKLEEPLQIVCKRIPLNVGHHDISHMDRKEKEIYLNEFMTQDRQRPFKIDAFESLWRIRTFSLNEKNIGFLWSGHHAIMDGWSYISFIPV